MSIHAAKLGTYASDGCCEYTPDDGQPAAMLCGACGCPHNLHRLAMVTRRWAVVLFVNTPAAAPAPPAAAAAPPRTPADSTEPPHHPTSSAACASMSMRSSSHSIAAGVEEDGAGERKRMEREVE
nr:unnamed protein product [Digitaria exilis]